MPKAIAAPLRGLFHLAAQIFRVGLRVLAVFQKHTLPCPWTSGIGFRSLTEAIDTTRAQGQLVFHKFWTLDDDFERSLIRGPPPADMMVRSHSPCNSPATRGKAAGPPGAAERLEGKFCPLKRPACRDY